MIEYVLGACSLLSSGGVIYLAKVSIDLSRELADAKLALALADEAMLKAQRSAEQTKDMLKREEAARAVERIPVPVADASAKVAVNILNHSLDALSRPPGVAGSRLPLSPARSAADNHALPAPRPVPGPAPGRDPKKGG